MEQTKKQIKQQLKHEHRDRLVEIGCHAIEHAFKALPQEDPSRKLISERLEALRRREIVEILAQVKRDRKKTVYPHTQATRLIDATQELVLLAASGKYLSGDAMDWILVPAYNSFVFVSDERQHEERQWQEKELHPLIEDSFEQLQNAERKLKAA